MIVCARCFVVIVDWLKLTALLALLASVSACCVPWIFVCLSLAILTCVDWNVIVCVYVMIWFVIVASVCCGCVCLMLWCVQVCVCLSIWWWSLCNVLHCVCLIGIVNMRLCDELTCCGECWSYCLLNVVLQVIVLIAECLWMLWYVGFVCTGYDVLTLWMCRPGVWCFDDDTCVFMLIELCSCVVDFVLMLCFLVALLHVRWWLLFVSLMWCAVMIFMLCCVLCDMLCCRVMMGWMQQCICDICALCLLLCGLFCEYVCMSYWLHLCDVLCLLYHCCMWNEFSIAVLCCCVCVYVLIHVCMMICAMLMMCACVFCVVVLNADRYVCVLSMDEFMWHCVCYVSLLMCLNCAFADCLCVCSVAWLWCVCLSRRCVTCWCVCAFNLVCIILDVSLLWLLFSVVFPPLPGALHVRLSPDDPVALILIVHGDLLWCCWMLLCALVLCVSINLCCCLWFDCFLCAVCCDFFVIVCVPLAMLQLPCDVILWLLPCVSCCACDACCDACNVACVLDLMCGWCVASLTDYCWFWYVDVDCFADLLWLCLCVSCLVSWDVIVVDAALLFIWMSDNACACCIVIVIDVNCMWLCLCCDDVVYFDCWVCVWCVDVLVRVLCIVWMCVWWWLVLLIGDDVTMIVDRGCVLRDVCFWFCCGCAVLWCVCVFFLLDDECCCVLNCCCWWFWMWCDCAVCVFVVCWCDGGDWSIVYALWCYLCWVMGMCEIVCDDGDWMCFDGLCDVFVLCYCCVAVLYYLCCFVEMIDCAVCVLFWLWVCAEKSLNVMCCIAYLWCLCDIVVTCVWPVACAVHDADGFHWLVFVVLLWMLCGRAVNWLTADVLWCLMNDVMYVFVDDDDWWCCCDMICVVCDWCVFMCLMSTYVCVVLVCCLMLFLCMMLLHVYMLVYLMCHVLVCWCMLIVPSDALCQLIDDFGIVVLACCDLMRGLLMCVMMIYVCWSDCLMCRWLNWLCDCWMFSCVFNDDLKMSKLSVVYALMCLFVPWMMPSCLWWVMCVMWLFDVWCSVFGECVMCLVDMIAVCVCVLDMIDLPFAVMLMVLLLVCDVC